MKTNIPTSDLYALAKAIEQSCPQNAERDRFGRLCGVRNSEPMRKLAIRWKIANGGYDSLDQAAMIARKMLQWEAAYTEGQIWADQFAKELKLGTWE